MSEETQANWAICDADDNDSVVDRFFTEEEAAAAIQRPDAYPPNCYVTFVADPGTL